jgi:predicted Zn-dependent protease with MMP-like domain
MRGVGRHDRHGRALRADGDPRRRPPDGYRVRDRRRFAALARRVVAELPDDLRHHLDRATVDVVDVPDARALRHVGSDPADVPLADLDLGGPGRPRVLHVHRRPIEARADRRSELIAVLDLAIRHAVQDALGLPRDPDPDD